MLRKGLRRVETGQNLDWPLQSHFSYKISERRVCQTELLEDLSFICHCSLSLDSQMVVVLRVYWRHRSSLRLHSCFVLVCLTLLC